MSRPLSDATRSDGRAADQREAERPLERWEQGAILVGLLILLGARVFAIYHHPIDSDEPQHLHVVWEWAMGRLPFRDIFDNHPPLFHLLFAPILHWIGERPDIVLVMRWMMLPFIALILWCVYRLGKSLYGKRTGVLAAFFCGFFPGFFFKAGEFRTDVLWTALWMLSLVLLAGRRCTLRRTFFGGLVFGAAACVSQKTILLLLALLVSIGLALLLLRQRHKELPGALAAAWFLAGVCLFPGALLLYFAAQGAWPALFYCLVQHNLISESQPENQLIHRIQDIRFWLFLPAFLFSALRFAGHADTDKAFRQIVVFNLPLAFCTILLGGWSLISKQDYLPFFPLFLLSAVAAVTQLWPAQAKRFALMRPAQMIALFLVFGAEIGWLESQLVRLSGAPVEAQVDLMRQILRITTSQDNVLDAKGQAIFRPRATRYVLETFTARRLKEGKLPDTIIADLIAHEAPVAIDLGYLQPKVRQFVQNNYLAVGRLHVVGQRLKSSFASDPIQFEVGIPQTYVLMDRAGLVPGVLDGKILAQPVFLGAGVHLFKPARPTDLLTLLWAGAWERGFRSVPEDRRFTAADGIKRLVREVSDAPHLCEFGEPKRQDDAGGRVYPINKVDRAAPVERPTNFVDRIDPAPYSARSSWSSVATPRFLTVER